MPMQPLILPSPCGGTPGHWRIAFERYRHLHYCERLKYEEPQKDGRERDEYDQSSTYIIVVEEGSIVGGCRLIPSHYGDHSPLPLESEYHGVIVRPTYEISRTLIRPGDCKVSRCEIGNILYGTIFEFLRNKKIRVAYAVVEPIYFHLLERKYPGGAFEALTGEYPVVHGAERLTHVAMGISVERWARHFEPAIAMVA